MFQALENQEMSLLTFTFYENSPVEKGIVVHTVVPTVTFNGKILLYSSSKKIIGYW